MSPGPKPLTRPISSSGKTPSMNFEKITKFPKIISCLVWSKQYQHEGSLRGQRTVLGSLTLPCQQILAFLANFLLGGQNSCLAGNMLASWATFLAYRQNSCLAGHNAPSC